MTRLSVLLSALATAAAAASRSGLAQQPPSSFRGSHAGEEREVDAINLCWCPPGRFVMGSPPDEPERRPGEDQVEVTLTKGFWMGRDDDGHFVWRQAE